MHGMTEASLGALQSECHRLWLQILCAAASDVSAVPPARPGAVRSVRARVGAGARASCAPGRRSLRRGAGLRGCGPRARRPPEVPQRPQHDPLARGADGCTRRPPRRRCRHMGATTGRPSSATRLRPGRALGARHRASVAPPVSAVVDAWRGSAADRRLVGTASCRASSRGQAHRPRWARPARRRRDHHRHHRHRGGSRVAGQRRRACRCSRSGANSTKAALTAIRQLCGI